MSLRGRLRLPARSLTALVSYRLLSAPERIQVAARRHRVRLRNEHHTDYSGGPFAAPMLYLALTKPDVSFLVVLTTLAGFYLGSRGALDWLRMAQTVFGTTLVAAGTSALNHCIERVTDAHMRRTASRPLPRGQLPPRGAAIFGCTLVVIGAVYLALTAGIEASLLGIVHVVSISRFTRR